MKCYLSFLFFCSLSVNIRAEDETVSVDKSIWDNIYDAAIIVCACTAKPIPTVPPQECSNRTHFDGLSVVEVNAAINLCENISGHDAAAGHQVANKPEPTKVAIHVVVIGVFCAFAAGVLVAIGCKYAYDRYRKRSYVLPPEQGMQM
ncbi:hypothetical protein B5X24_HaOG214262 [Helicoverpa armigera]|nr:hypothetical protein B5X24_HaOG214262 [Helicoverpa armigera]